MCFGVSSWVAEARELLVPGGLVYVTFSRHRIEGVRAEVVAQW